MTALADKLGASVDRAVAAQPERDRILAEIAGHRTNLAALHCDEPAAPGTAAALPDIAGTWYREGDRSKPTSVAGSGDHLTFTNEFHPAMVSKGHFAGAGSVVADDWEGGLVGTLSGDGRRIDWANGSSWQR